MQGEEAREGEEHPNFRIHWKHALLTHVMNCPWQNLKPDIQQALLRAMYEDIAEKRSQLNGTKGTDHNVLNEALAKLTPEKHLNKIV